MKGHRLHKSLDIIGSWWLALGVALSTATQLRFAQLPIGPGEIILSGWIFIMAIGLLVRGRLTRGSVQRVLGLFWFVSLVLLGLGWLVAIHTMKWETRQSRDLVAFALSAMLVLMMVSQEQLDFTIQRSSLIVAVLSVVSVALLFLLSQTSHQVGPLGLYYGPRFVGWARNPNQMAFALVLTPFLLWKHLSMAVSVGRRVVLAILVPITLLVGYITMSDALLVAWAASFCILLLFQLYRSQSLIGWKRVDILLKWALVPAIVLVLLIVFGSNVYRNIWNAVETMYLEGNQGPARIALWKNGIAAISASPFVGFGPGSHSGFGQPFQGYEAHNTLIDWGTSTGMIGVLMYIGLFSWVGYRMWRSRDSVGFSAVCALIIFSLFHYVLRHPLFWYHTVALAVMSGREPVSSAGLYG